MDYTTLILTSLNLILGHIARQQAKGHDQIVYIDQQRLVREAIVARANEKELTDAATSTESPE